MPRGYFSIKRDIEVEKAGGFFCPACSVGKPLDDQSPDPRYCLGCYDFLLKEARMVSTSRPGWIPRVQPQALTGQKTEEKSIKVSGDIYGIMSILEDPKSEVDIIKPTVPKTTLGKRGPKHKPLPQELVTKLASEGMGSRAIATKLREQGISVSYKTVQRVLSGQRLLVLGVR